MNWLDLTLLAIWVILALVGLFRGLIRMVFPLIGLVLGVFLAGQFHAALARGLTFIEGENLSRIVAFILIFLAVLIGVSILGIFARKFLRLLTLGWLDRLGGLLVGLLIGWIAAGALTYLLARYIALPANLPTGEGIGAWLENWRAVVQVRQEVTAAIENSKLAGFFLRTFPSLLHLLPKEFDVVRRFFGT